VKSYLPGFPVKAGCFPVAILLGFFSRVGPLTWRCELQGDWVGGVVLPQLSYLPFLYWKSLHYQLPQLTPNHLFLRESGCALAWLLAALFILVLAWPFLPFLPSFYCCNISHACHSTTTFSSSCFSSYLTSASSASYTKSGTSST